MSFDFKREIEVAFSKRAQPVWFRILKYIILSLVIYFFWGIRLAWILLAVFTAGLCLHFWYRYKTQGWTRKYGYWDDVKNSSSNP